jgi:hypothetical protein
MSALNPLKILEKAVKQVPQLKYAFGVLGLVSVIAIVVGLKVDLQIAVFGVIVVLILMVLLVVFAQLVAANPAIFLLPVLVFLWTAVGVGSLTAIFLFTSAFFNYPLDLEIITHPKPPPSVPSPSGATLIPTSSGQLTLKVLFSPPQLRNGERLYVQTSWNENFNAPYPAPPEQIRDPSLGWAFTAFDTKAGEQKIWFRFEVRDAEDKLWYGTSDSLVLSAQTS